MNNKKKMVCDADGVLVNWEYAFNLWVQDLGLVPVPGTEKVYDLSVKYGISKENCRNIVRKFNSSISIGYLPAMRDSVEYVTRLSQEGYVFDVVTSLSLDPFAQKLRTQNLKKLFGNVFDQIHYLDTGANKDEVLFNNYYNSGLIWIEDKIENANAGFVYGLKPILLAHGHNFEYRNEYIPVAKNWKEIYDMVKESETGVKLIA